MLLHFIIIQTKHIGFTEIVYDQDFYDNSDIEFEISNFILKDKIKPYETKTMYITFKYKDGKVSENTILNSYLNFKMEELVDMVIATTDYEGIADSSKHSGSVSVSNLSSSDYTISYGTTYGNYTTKEKPTYQLAKKNTDGTFAYDYNSNQNKEDYSYKTYFYIKDLTGKYNDYEGSYLTTIYPVTLLASGDENGEATIDTTNNNKNNGVVLNADIQNCTIKIDGVAYRVLYIDSNTNKAVILRDKVDNSNPIVFTQPESGTLLDSTAVNNNKNVYENSANTYLNNSIKNNSGLKNKIELYKPGNLKNTTYTASLTTSNFYILGAGGLTLEETSIEYIYNRVLFVNTPLNGGEGTGRKYGFTTRNSKMAVDNNGNISTYWLNWYMTWSGALTIGKGTYFGFVNTTENQGAGNGSTFGYTALSALSNNPTSYMRIALTLDLNNINLIKDGSSTLAYWKSSKNYEVPNYTYVN